MGGAATAAGRRSGNGGGGRQIAWFHVLLALGFLIVFGVSFGFVFEYAALAVHSLEAELDEPAHCTIIDVVAVANVTCEGGSPAPAAAAAVPCYVVRGIATRATDSATAAESTDGDSVAGNAAAADASAGPAVANATAAITAYDNATAHTVATSSAERVDADRLILHAYYSDFYTSRHCTFTMCDDGGAGGGRLSAGRRSKLRLLRTVAGIESAPPPSLVIGPVRPAEEFAALAAGNVGTSPPTVSTTRQQSTEKAPPSGLTVRCWLDRRKPGRAFLGLNEVPAVVATPEAESSESSLPFERVEAIAVLAAPPTVMLACIVALAACVASGRLRADEVHQPVVTPNHILIDGRWYLRSRKPPGPAAADGGRTDGGAGSGGGSNQQDPGKWQTLKQALGQLNEKKRGDSG